MIAVGTYLAVIGAADLVASGLGGSIPTRRRLYAGLLTGAVGFIAIGLWLGIDARQWWLGGTLNAIAMAGWLAPRALDDAPPRAHGIALTILVFGFAASALVGSSYADVSVPQIDLALTGVQGLSSADIAVGFAFLLALATTGNAVVRSSLITVGADFQGGSDRLRGGRLIGVLERYIIFGFAVSGEAVAAAIVVSAKSLIRFPELREAADEPGDRIDELTEYFLLGSMLSWSIALLFSAAFA